MRRERQAVVPLVSLFAMNGSMARTYAAPVDARAPEKSQTGEAAQARFEVRNFKALIDNRPPTVVENPEALRYEAPRLKISATLRCTLPVGSRFTVGFIQQVNYRSVRADYRRAFTSFELPSVPMSDADGTDVPWDGNTHERATVTGKGTPEDVELSTDDRLSGYITWQEPLPPDGVRKGSTAELEHVKRDEKFTTWLAVRDDRTNRIAVMKKVSWEIQVDVSVNPHLPLGSRATVRAVPVKQPSVVTPSSSSPASLSIPPECLDAPLGNFSQQFWWTPKIDGVGKRTRLQ